jgi:nicotinamide mononucleotide transporter
LLNGSAPLLDAVITALSLVAQWLLNRKRIESWPVWIVVDVLTITLGAWRGLYLLSALYLSYLAMCVAGWLQWRAGVDKRGGENDA